MDGSEYTFVLFKYMHYLTPFVFYDGTVLYSSFDTVGIRILHEKIVVMCIIVILYITVLKEVAAIIHTAVLCICFFIFKL